MEIKKVEIKIAYAVLTNNRGRFIVYSPHLNVVGYGKSSEEAEADFEVAIQDFISFHYSENQLREKLISLGYRFYDHKSKAPDNFSVPTELLRNAQIKGTGNKSYAIN